MRLRKNKLEERQKLVNRYASITMYLKELEELGCNLTELQLLAD